ncbi:MAG: nuclear transport factor 2 family protein [Novosphingobium sp.]
MAPAQELIARPADFARYVETFNSADQSFVDFYASDVVFDKGVEDGVLVGRQAIAEWYARFWQDFDETLTPITVVIDDEAQVMMVELRTELVAKRDGLVWRDRTYRAGDRLVVDGTIVYGLDHGLIRSIRGAAEGRQIIPAAGG